MLHETTTLIIIIIMRCSTGMFKIKLPSALEDPKIIIMIISTFVKLYLPRSFSVVVVLL